MASEAVLAPTPDELRGRRITGARIARALGGEWYWAGSQWKERGTTRRVYVRSQPCRTFPNGLVYLHEFNRSSLDVGAEILAASRAPEGDANG